MRVIWLVQERIAGLLTVPKLVLCCDAGLMSVTGQLCHVCGATSSFMRKILTRMSLELDREYCFVAHTDANKSENAVAEEHYVCDRG